MKRSIRFSINRISAPNLPFDAFLAMCKRLGVDSVEIRNDLPGAELQDHTSPAVIKAAAAIHGITIRSINALYPFDVFDAELEGKAVALARYAQQCGAEALVMCPLNSVDDKRSSAERRSGLVASLKSLRPILEDHGVQGLVEPLGFRECALRRKSDAVQAIQEVGGEATYRLVHDTFHHYLAGEDRFFPELTGLVHVSGVESPALADEDMRDEHRVLVGKADRLDNVGQLRALIDGGYTGVVSFEPFAREIMGAKNSEALLKTSMDYIRTHVCGV